MYFDLETMVLGPAVMEEIANYIPSQGSFRWSRGKLRVTYAQIATNFRYESASRQLFQVSRHSLCVRKLWREPYSRRTSLVDHGLWTCGPWTMDLWSIVQESESSFENLTFKGPTLGYWSEAVCGVERCCYVFCRIGSPMTGDSKTLRNHGTGTSGYRGNRD